MVLPQGGLWLAADCDGDGVTNGQEIIDGTNLSDPCESIEENVSLPQSQEFLAGDCDGDGLNNGEEIGNNPNNPNDSNGNGIPDYLEINNHSVSQDDLEIFNLVTPNADGDNDIFVIRNIELYPNNSVEIYNRWGIKVYETKESLTKEFGKEFFVAKIVKESNTALPNEVHGYSTSVEPRNAMFDIRRKLPLFTKSSDSKSLYCAGYYVIKFDKGRVKSFCPKLITLQRYEYKGPFKTEFEMKQVLANVSK